MAPVNKKGAAKAAPSFLILWKCEPGNSAIEIGLGRFRHFKLERMD